MRLFSKLVILVTLTALIPICAPPLAQTKPDDKAIADTIDKAKILDKGYKVSAKLNDTEAIISTYGHKASTDIDKDCKIDASLIARELILNNNFGLTRVTANFYDPELTGSYRQVVLTKAEITALGSGAIKQEEFLSSIRCNVMQEQKAAAETEAASAKSTSDSSSEATAETMSASPDKIEVASSTGSASSTKPPVKEPKKLPRYVSDSYGFSFNIPNGWTADDNISHGKGTLLKMHSRTTDYDNIELSLTTNKKSPAELALEQRKTFSYGGVRIERYEQAKVGQGGYNGALSILTYPHESGEDYYEMHCYFGNPGRIYNIWGWCPKKDYRIVAPAFWELMNSIHLAKADPAAKIVPAAPPKAAARKK
ncbi:MAG: hypothetical protein K2X81_20300 [Candidatus Obscuribacterales bacterium]|nr:hypothetical protein [Candidatus Obscuribacterales bacterium]